jgi:hypothetical protein
MDKDLRKEIDTIIADALAGAGEQLATQAQTAATQAISSGLADMTGKLDQFGKQLAAVTPEAVNKTVAETVKTTVAGELKAREDAAAKKAAEDGAKDKVTQARAKFLADKAAKLPETYHALIPVTDKPAELEAGLAAAQAKLEADLKAMGATLPSLGASAGGEVRKVALDPAKMSPTQKIAAGLESMKK